MEAEPCVQCLKDISVVETHVQCLRHAAAGTPCNLMCTLETELKHLPNSSDLKHFSTTSCVMQVRATDTGTKWRLSEGCGEG